MFFFCSLTISGRIGFKLCNHKCQTILKFELARNFLLCYSFALLIALLPLTEVLFVFGISHIIPMSEVVNVVVALAVIVFVARWATSSAFYDISDFMVGLPRLIKCMSITIR